MIEILGVGIGGFIGSVLRYLLTKIIPSGFFPFPTLTANILAGFSIGIVAGLDNSVFQLPQKWRLFATTGIFGGLSTFSTFNLETIKLFDSGRYTAAGLNIIVNISLSLFGFLLGKSIIRAVVPV